MTFLGLSGDIDVDLDGDGDVDVSGGHSITIFSVRNAVAFFTFFGWSGLWMLRIGASPFFTTIASVLIGVIFVGISMSLFFLISKMQRSGTLDLSNAIGKTGDVYIPIPPRRMKTGKVLINVQGALRELDAVTDDETLISTGTPVDVVGILQPSKLLVTTSSKGDEHVR